VGLRRAAADAARCARLDLGVDHGAGDRWAKMMFGVLDEVDRAGGEVSRRRFLEIGEEHSYSRRGMAGFYQQLVQPAPGFKTRLTSSGKRRLAFLRDRFGATA
jgi:hypothetical protein